VLVFIIIMLMLQEMANEIIETYIIGIHTQNKELTELFRNTLDVIPNGVLIIDIKTRSIIFANKEMDEIMGLNTGVPT
jgi:PAS domain-containing protein